MSLLGVTRKVVVVVVVMTRTHSLLVVNKCQYSKKREKHTTSMTRCAPLKMFVIFGSYGSGDGGDGGGVSKI